MLIQEHIDLFEELKDFKKVDFEIIKNPNYDLDYWGDQISYYVQVTKLKNGKKIAKGYNSNKKIPIYSSMRDYWHIMPIIRTKIICYFQKQGDKEND